MTSQAFLDVRNHGFIRVAVCSPKVTVADPTANLDAHLVQIEQVYRDGAMYACFPELSLTAYTCKDLFLSQTLQTAAVEALNELMTIALLRYPDLLMTVGLPLKIHDQLFNTAVTFIGDQLLAITPKTYRPNYGEFEEARWFAPGREAKTTSLDPAQLGIVTRATSVPFSQTILICSKQHPDFRLGLDICEDLWVPISPSRFAALAGASVLANPSASNATIGKADFRRLLVNHSSGTNLVAQLYAATGPGESSSDLVFDGHSMISERGMMLAETTLFKRDGDYRVVDINLNALIQDRLRQTSFSENALDVGRASTEVWYDTPEIARDQFIYQTFRRTFDPYPFVPSDPVTRDDRCEEVFTLQANALMTRLLALPETHRKIIIGLSGGKDSVHALCVAVKAMDELQLPRTDIIAMTLPSFGTTSETKQSAERLAKAFGVTFFDVSITPIAQAVFTAIGFDPKQHGYTLTFENTQAWSRMVTLFAKASQVGGIDLGTGDWTELLKGWCTYGGDHMSHYGINAGIGKTLITYLLNWAADHIYQDETLIQQELRLVAGAVISPELLPPGVSGEIVQKTEDLIGPNALTDFFGYYTIRFGIKPSLIARMALAAFEGIYSLAEIKYWLEKFYPDLFRTQYKRNCLPDGPKVGASLSPRGDWRMPADAKPTAWLTDLSSIKETDLT